MVSTRLGDLDCTAFNNLKFFDRLGERKLFEIWGKQMYASLYLPPTPESAGGRNQRPRETWAAPRTQAVFTYVRKHSGWPVALSTSFRHRSRVRRRQTRGAITVCNPGHSASCTGKGSPGNRTTKTRHAQPGPWRRRFRGIQVPDPPPAGANGSTRTFTGPLVSSSAFELSLNFLFCIPEGPTGVMRTSFKFLL